MSSKLRHVVEPSPGELLSFLKDALAHRAFILLIAKCSVSYYGRSRTELGSGDRLIVIKEDGSFLVHSKTGYAPVNWQPSGARVTAYLSADGRVIVEATRAQPYERVRVFIEHAYLAAAGTLKEPPAPLVSLTEEDLRTAILIDPDMVEPGIHFGTIEWPVGVGRADIVGRDRSGTVVVVEVKRECDRSGAEQLWRYLTKLHEYGVSARGILVAFSFTHEARRFARARRIKCVAVSPKRVMTILERWRRSPGRRTFSSGST